MIFCILTLLITMPLFSMDWIDYLTDCAYTTPVAHQSTQNPPKITPECTTIQNKTELIVLSAAVNNFFSSKENKDCIGYINQKILEKTDTHLWAARTILSKKKPAPAQSLSKHIKYCAPYNVICEYGNTTIVNSDHTTEQISLDVSTVWSNEIRLNSNHISKRVSFDKRFDKQTTKLICSDQYLLLFDHYRLLIINRTTSRLGSYYEHQKPIYAGLLTLCGNTLVEKDKKGNIFHSQLIHLDPDTIGTHIYTIEAAVTLCALHHEVKKDGGPVCNDGFNKFILEQKDFSPFLWPIIAAQGTHIILPYFFRGDTNKQHEHHAWCSCWVQ
jgi:hypothetical protein